MTDTYHDLQLYYTGPIPQGHLDRLKHGSSVNAAIFETEGSIAFYRDEIIRMRRSAKKWFAQGNLEMARHNMDDSWLYLRAWRKLRVRLKDLRAQAKTEALARAERAQVLNAEQVFEIISPREPGDG